MEIENGYNMKYSAGAKPGSSGSPILNLHNFKVLGIHKGVSNNSPFGTYINAIIEKINKNLSFGDN